MGNLHVLYIILLYVFCLVPDFSWVSRDFISRDDTSTDRPQSAHTKLPTTFTT